jgi:glycolate oxidase iron-sulfur subunit
MCSSSCPTYILSEEENESPRGRISLMRALATGQLEADEKSLAHLDHCLLCRSCEKKCPSGVEYAQLYNLSQTQLASKRAKPSQLEQQAQILAHERPQRQRLFKFARIAQITGISKLARYTQFARAEQLLPTPLKAHFSDFNTNQQASVALFTGCANESSDSDSIHACLAILHACEVDVSTPVEQSCCGALAQHSGDQAAFRQQQERNQLAFAPQQDILFLATGCGASLRDYPSDFAQRTFEACGYINKLESLRELTFSALNKKVSIHQPCSHRNVIGDANVSQQLLQHIPELQISAPSHPNCCGAGGTTMLTQPELADSLRENMLDSLLEQQPDYLVSTNIGCALHQLRS